MASRQLAAILFSDIVGYTSMIQLLSRCHGPKVPANMPEQIDSFVGGCDEFLAAGEEPDEVGECADIHFSQHLP